MMRYLYYLAALLLFSCGKTEKKDALYPESAQTSAEAKNPKDHGKELFENAGNCVACHLPEQKVIGPSITEIAKIYKDKGGNIVSFLQGKEDPIVDPSQFSVMQANFAITKNMSETELKALETYIYSFSP